MVPPPPGLPLVADPEAFLAKPAVPLHRDHQLSELRSSFAGALARARPIHVWAYGSPGTGKTLCVRYLLQSEVRQTGVLPIFVNCRERFTFLGVLEDILDAVRPLRSPQRTRESQLAILREALGDRRSVVALDEIDVLPPSDVESLLHHLCGLPRVTVICVAGSRQLLLKLPEAVRSRLAPRQVLFPRYQPDEMMAILAGVAGKGLSPGSWAEDALRNVADHAYGDARRAIALLRHAVQRAEELGDACLSPAHLRPENSDHFSASTEDLLAPLSSHHRMLYDIVSSGGAVPTGRLEAEYHEACRRQGLEPISSRTISKYLDTLCQRRILRREHGAGTPGWVYRTGQTSAPLAGGSVT